MPFCVLRVIWKSFSQGWLSRRIRCPSHAACSPSGLISTFSSAALPKYPLAESALGASRERWWHGTWKVHSVVITLQVAIEASGYGQGPPTVNQWFYPLVPKGCSLALMRLSSKRYPSPCLMDTRCLLLSGKPTGLSGCLVFPRVRLRGAWEALRLECLTIMGVFSSFPLECLSQTGKEHTSIPAVKNWSITSLPHKYASLISVGFFITQTPHLCTWCHFKSWINRNEQHFL